jgi:hypothetical protein
MHDTKEELRRIIEGLYDEEEEYKCEDQREAEAAAPWIEGSTS